MKWLSTSIILALLCMDFVKSGEYGKPDDSSKPVEAPKPEAPSKPDDMPKSEAPSKPDEMPKPEAPSKPDEMSKPEAPSAPASPYGEKTPPKGAYIQQLHPQNPFDIKGDDVDKGGDVTKACRYDEPAWSDCDPFELTRYRTLRLVSGGRQCEEAKNMTQKCTPHELPAGTKWLIDEHRKCIAELKRLKIMIADLAKYITVLREKGHQLFNSYLALKKHLDQLKIQLEDYHTKEKGQQGRIEKVRAEMEEWKGKARELQHALDDLKHRYHDLEKEHKEGEVKLGECRNEAKRCKVEIQAKKTQLHQAEVENSELKRRLMDAQKYKDQLKEVRNAITKQEYQAEKLHDKLEIIVDDVATCKLDLLNAEVVSKPDHGRDTKMDLSMEMWIIHNKTKEALETTVEYTYATEAPEAKKEEYAKCLISYYGITNETCWYDSNSESVEAEEHDTLGKHKIEAHWKYFTLDVKDQYECDKASHLHYEFLLHRCQPKHYLPVLSVFRPNGGAKELATKIYPKPNIPQPGSYNRCWITFLGPQGHCERRKDHFPLYNSDDTKEGYQKAKSGESKSYCLNRAKVWADYCENPVIATYLPEGVSSNWKDQDIQHDNHGGRMFEEKVDLKHVINVESIKPHNVKRPSEHVPEQYEDTPEFRQSMNLKGEEKEALLKKLRARLGAKKMSQEPAPGTNAKVLWQGANKNPSMGGKAPKPAVEAPKNEEAKPAADPYHAPKANPIKKEEPIAAPKY